MKIQKLGSQHNVSIELSSDLQIELEDNENASKLINETKAQLKNLKAETSTKIYWISISLKLTLVIETKL